MSLKNCLDIIVFGNKTDLDELAVHQFKQDILGDAKEAVERVDPPKTIKDKIIKKQLKEQNGD